MKFSEDFSRTEEEKIFLRELLLRNEITHDYFDREMHLREAKCIHMIRRLVSAR